MSLTLFTGRMAGPFYLPNVQKSFSLAGSGSLPFNTFRCSTHQTAQIGNKLIGRCINSKNPVMKKLKSAINTAKDETLNAAKVCREFALRNPSVSIRVALVIFAISALGYFTVPMVSTWLEGSADIYNFSYKK